MNFPQFGYISLPLDKGNVSLFERILAVLDKEMAEPTLYGWFHLICLAIVIGLCVLVVLKCKHFTQRQVRLTLGVTVSVMIAFEIYKQLNFSYSPSTDTWSYQWYAFPYQFCSTPMYVMPAVLLIKNEKVQRSLYAYLATYSLFAGIGVMLYPSTVFIETIGINIQTMVHHGAMVVIGVFMYATGTLKIQHKTILHAVPVFAVLSSVALVANVLFGLFGDPSHTFDMFFISPFEEPSLPLVSLIFADAPYILYLCGYLLGFTTAGYLMVLLAMLCVKLHARAQAKKTTFQQTEINDVKELL